MAGKTVIMICAFVALGSLIFGMDGGYFNGVVAMDRFREDFGEWNPRLKSYSIPSAQAAFMTSFPFLGQLLGALMGGYIGHRWGRRLGLVVMALTSALGVLFQLFTTNQGVFVTGRFINYVSIGFATIFVPVYQAECAPENIRGRMIALYQLNIVVGSLFISVINALTKSMLSQWSYKIPILLLMVLPVAMLPGLYFLPESPRWLMCKRREQEARRSIEIINRGTNFDVDAEVRRLRESVAHQEETNKSSTFIDCFRRTNRARTFVAIGIQLWQQLTGISFVFNYSNLFFKEIGIKNPFPLTIATNVVNLVGTIASLFLVDRLGRRKLLFLGSGIMFVGHLIVGVGGLLDKDDPHAARAVIAFIWVYVFGFAVSWGPVCWIVSSEIATTAIREKTQALASASNIIFSFAVSMAVPHITQNDGAGLGSKVGFIFASTVLLGAIWVWFRVPELKNRSLESLDYLYQHNIAPRKFASTEVPSSIDTPSSNKSNAKCDEHIPV